MVIIAIILGDNNGKRSRLGLSAHKNSLNISVLRNSSQVPK